MDTLTAPTNTRALATHSAQRDLTYRLIWAGVLLACGWGGSWVWSYAEEQASGPAAGTSLEGPARDAEPLGNRIRLGLYNIHGGRGTDGRRDLARTASLLREAHLDFIGLNEVHGGAGGNQASEIAMQLQMGCLFAATEKQWQRDHFGSAALCRRKVDFWQRIPLPRVSGSGYRNVTLYRLPAEASELKVLVTHLDRVHDRARQLGIVLDLFRSLEPPVVLMGDLNTNRDDPQLRQWLADPEIVDCIGQTGAGKSLLEAGRIDWILGRGVRRVDAGLSEIGPSDHPCAWSEIEWR
ncbi:MAG TPA: endonuclease/exonuclease/phosphatase family protein [Planctomycetaceae bacterium]|nr:endonuclease/exonuclease/phosphatase family protein [Planctomycetaceae bacterium]